MRLGLLLVGGLLFLSLQSQAQDYLWAAGLRVGGSPGLTGKYSIGDITYVEGLMTFRWHGVTITGLYELHAKAFNEMDLYWYYGGGAHLGFWNEARRHPYYDNYEGGILLGIDGIIGIEYYIRDIPFILSLDWKPALNLIDHTGLFYDELAISIRYTP